LWEKGSGVKGESQAAGGVKEVKHIEEKSKGTNLE